ncbi:MAG: efflux transporter outer membrane subunit, partial [Gallionella sp.]
KRPVIDTPAQYKENSGWINTASIATQSPVSWWTVYGDETLNRLEPLVASANQSLRASFFAYRQALALTDAARAGEFPTLNAAVSSTRTGSGSGTSAVPVVSGKTVSLTASWVPDFWGKVRRQVEANTASAEANRDNLIAAQLSLQAALAQDYFLIRQLDSQIVLARDTVTAFEKSLQLANNRYTAGVATKADVALAESQLANARVQLVTFGVQRAQLEHAIAVLIGESPSRFILPAVAGMPKPQAIPAGLPSQLLLRRPDLLAAERQVAASNAQIGVAESAYFPALTLSAQGGWHGPSFAGLLVASGEFWSIGPSLAATLFDSGARGAQVAQSQAAYQQTVAQYRQLSLQALQQVEDQLAATSILAEEAELQQQAVTAADESMRLATNQYKAGIVSYLNVVTAQAAAYTARNSYLQIEGQRLNASVALIQALGGGWGEDNQVGRTPDIRK